MADQNVEAPEIQDEPELESADAPESVNGTSVESDDFGSPEGFDPESLSPEERKIAEQYERQFKGHYTKKTQELAEQRKQYEQAQALVEWFDAVRQEAGTDQLTEAELLQVLQQRLGIAPDDEEDDLDEEDEEQQYHDPRVDKIEEFLQTAAVEEFQNQKADAVGDELDALAKKLGRDFDEWELQEILDRAVMQTQSIEDAVDVTRKYVERLRRQEAAVQERWIKSKSMPQVANGVPGSEQLDLNDRDTRRKLMEDIVAARTQN